MILRQPQCLWLHDGLAATSLCGVLARCALMSMTGSASLFMQQLIPSPFYS